MSRNLKLTIIIATPIWLAVVACLWWVLMRADSWRPFPTAALPLLTALLCAAAAYPLFTLKEIWRERKSRQSAAPQPVTVHANPLPLDKMTVPLSQKGFAGNRTSRAMYYREKAEKLQRLVPQMSSEEAKQSFIHMADDYLDMAAKLERLAVEKSDASLKL